MIQLRPFSLIFKLRYILFINNGLNFINFILTIINIFVFLAIVSSSIVPILIQFFIHLYCVVLVYGYYFAAHAYIYSTTCAFFVTFPWKKTRLHTMSL